MEQSPNENFPVHGSILAKENTRLNRIKERKAVSTEKKKTVVWDTNSIEEQKKERTKECIHTETYVQCDTKQISKALSLTSTSKNSNRRNSTRIMSSISQKFKLFFEDQLVVEVINADGTIKKEKMPIRETGSNEFNKTRNQKYVNEYVKAAEFFNQNIEERDCEDDNAEDTFTNTIRNQYVGKLSLLDSGAKNVPYKLK